MSLRVVCHDQLLKSNGWVAARDLGPGLSYAVHSIEIYNTPDGGHELVKIDTAISVLIEMAKELLTFLAVEAQAVIFQSPSEIVILEGPVTILVHC